MKDPWESEEYGDDYEEDVEFEDEEVMASLDDPPDSYFDGTAHLTTEAEEYIEEHHEDY